MSGLFCSYWKRVQPTKKTSKTELLRFKSSIFCKQYLRVYAAKNLNICGAFFQVAFLAIKQSTLTEKKQKYDFSKQHFSPFAKYSLIFSGKIQVSQTYLNGLFIILANFSHNKLNILELSSIFQSQTLGYNVAR